MRWATSFSSIFAAISPFIPVNQFTERVTCGLVLLFEGLIGGCLGMLGVFLEDAPVGDLG